MDRQGVCGASGEFQKIAAALMRTLLEEYPALLGAEEIDSLMDAQYCKDALGLRIANHPLLRHRNQGRRIQGRDRYWSHAYAGAFHVCSQWWKDHHRTNVRALSRFASALARRRPEHPGSRALLRHVDALDCYAAGGKAVSAAVPARRAPQARPTRQPGADWPVWQMPSDADVRELARAMAPFVRFLDPGIVSAVAEDNRRRRADWSSRLEVLGIDPAIYLWEGSPCAFPGVRRYAGSTERAVLRKRAAVPQCLALDDNDYPKHVWAFACTGKPFRKRGPDGYQLAHLFDHKADHKEYGNRWREELGIPPDAKESVPPHGLFTSAANAAYVPGAFLMPTDCSPKLRSLIQRRALQLYGNVCRIVPPPLSAKPCEERNWSLDNFQWSTPVGCMDNIPSFLEFRRQRLDALFDKRHEALRNSRRR